MKKKNVLTMALSVSLVGVIAVGGTLAYLTANTGVVENTFTTSDNIQMNLNETALDEDGKADPSKPRVTTNTYNDVVPGVAYDKDPSVQMTSVPTGGAYVFMAVTGLDTDSETDKYTVATEISSEWEKLTDNEGKDGLYVYVGTDDAADKWETVQTDTRMTALFRNVTFTFSNDFNDDKDDDGQPDHTIGSIDVVAYAAQAQGTDFATVAQNALDTLMGKSALNDASFNLDLSAVTKANPNVPSVD